MPPVSPSDPNPSLADTPLTDQKEPETTNTISKGGGEDLDFESLKKQLRDRCYSDELITYAIEEVKKTAADQEVKFPLRYCIAAADRRAEEIAKAESRTALMEQNGHPPEDFEVDENAAALDEAIARLTEEERGALREAARAQLPPIARKLEPALYAQMRQIFRERQTEEINT